MPESDCRDLSRPNIVELQGASLSCLTTAELRRFESGRTVTRVPCLQRITDIKMQCKDRRSLKDGDGVRVYG